MRKNMLRRVLVTATAATALVTGSLAGATTSFATPAQTGAASSTEVSPLAVVNLGLSTTQARYLQCYLKNGGWGYTGALDGELGTNSWKAMQRRLADGFGYNDSIDGIVGTNTVMALHGLPAVGAA
jgi:lysozyme family protein